MTRLFALLIPAAFALADTDTLAARYGPFGGSNPYDDGGGDGNSGSGGSSGNSGRSGDFGSFGGLPFDVESAMRYRTIHGILAALAFVVLFPAGAVLMRIVPGRAAIWCHAVCQVVAYLVYIAAAALGIYMVRTVRLPFRGGGGSLLENPQTQAHPILGLVCLAALFLQPLLGYVHHVRFKQLGRRTWWSHAHLWNGRLFISLGIVTGGLGLRLAGAPAKLKVAYAVVAAVMWAGWLAVAIMHEARRAKTTTKEAVPVAEHRTSAAYYPPGYYAAHTTTGGASRRTSTAGSVRR